VGVYGSNPPGYGFRVADTSDAQARIDAGALTLADTVEPGAAGTVDANTVVYDEDGAVAAAPVIARLDDGRRVYARVEPSLSPSLAGELLVGRRIRLVAGDGPPTYDLI
jgi:hypothetical protein